MTEPMFRGELAFLSNFYLHQFYVPALGTAAPSAEHAYMALKTLEPGEQFRVLTAPTPGEAKRLGRRVVLRPDWHTGARVWAMRTVLSAKFSDPYLRDLLLATGDLPLVETNEWHDQFWGSCYCPQHAAAPGVNMLGELLMSARTFLRNGAVQ